MLSDLYNSVANVSFTKPELFLFLNTCWSMLTKAFCFYFVFVVVFFVCFYVLKSISFLVRCVWGLGNDHGSPASNSPHHHFYFLCLSPH